MRSLPLKGGIILSLICHFCALFSPPMLLLQYEVQETLHHLHENEGYQEEIRRGRGRVEYAIFSCFPKKKMQNLGNGLSVRACLAGNAYQLSQGKLCTTQLPCKCRFWYSLVNAVPCKCGLWLKCSWLQLTQHNLVLLTPNLPAKNYSPFWL